MFYVTNGLNKSSRTQRIREGGVRVEGGGERGRRWGEGDGGLRVPRASVFT